MSLPITIKDGMGTGNIAKVSSNNLHVTSSGSPAAVEKLESVMFFQYFTDDGLSTGSSDLLVDGSTTPVDFWIPSSSTADRYISEIEIFLAWPTTISILFGEFGNDGSPLGTGFDLLHTTQLTSNYVRQGVTTNGDLALLANSPDFTQYRSMFAANDYGIKANIEVHDLLSPYGLVLRKNTQDKLVIRINDDMTAIAASLFQASVLGFDRLLD